MADYCAKADLVERFGTAELVQLTDQTNTPPTTADDAEITDACHEASSLIDAYLGARFTLPLATVPPIVKRWACDIARRYLWKDRAKDGSAVVLNYDGAMSQLRDVGKGVAALPDATGLLAPESGGQVTVVTSERVFTDDMLSLMPGL